MYICIYIYINVYIYDIYIYILYISISTASKKQCKQIMHSVRDIRVPFPIASLFLHTESGITQFTAVCVIPNPTSPQCPWPLQ